jgi:N-acetylglucosamine-6-sulfatase
LVTPRWKFIRAYGVWDVHELYDLQSDPDELQNLYNDPAHRPRALEMDKRLFELLEQTGGDSLPMHRGWTGNAKEERSPEKSSWAPFPQSLMHQPEKKPATPPKK